MLPQEKIYHICLPDGQEVFFIVNATKTADATHLLTLIEPDEE